MYEKQVVWLEGKSCYASVMILPHKYEGKVRIQKNFSNTESRENIEAWEPSEEDLSFVEGVLDESVIAGEVKQATFVLDQGRPRFGRVTFTTDGLDANFREDSTVSLSFDHNLPGVISVQGATMREVVPKFEEEASTAVKSLNSLLRNLEIRSWLDS